MKVVYLQLADKGLTTFIDGKRFFVDKRSAQDLTSPGIAFCEVSKEFDSYGFLTGSYECPVESVSFSDVDDSIQSNLIKVYKYGNCCFYVVQDGMSDGGMSVFYQTKGMTSAECITSNYRGKATYSNNAIISYLKSCGEDVTISYWLERSINLKDLLDKGNMDGFMELFCAVSEDNISKVLLLEDGKSVQISSSLYSEYTKRYIFMKKETKGTFVTKTVSPTTSLVNSIDITKDIHDYIASHYICYMGFRRQGYQEGVYSQYSVFLNSECYVRLTRKDGYTVERWEANRELVEESVKDYKNWISSLKRYVSVKNAKQFRSLQLDRLLWRVG